MERGGGGEGEGGGVEEEEGGGDEGSGEEEEEAVLAEEVGDDGAGEGAVVVVVVLRGFGHRSWGRGRDLAMVVVEARLLVELLHPIAATERSDPSVGRLVVVALWGGCGLRRRAGDLVIPLFLRCLYAGRRRFGFEDLVYHVMHGPTQSEPTTL